MIPDSRSDRDVAVSAVASGFIPSPEKFFKAPQWFDMPAHLSYPG
jgi:hypothetical protein